MLRVEGPSQRLKEIGAEEVAGYIKKRVRAPVSGRIVLEAVESLKVERGVEQMEIYGHPRQVLAVVTHEFGSFVHRMEDWIPEIKEDPKYDSPEGRILQIFGISHLKDFTRRTQPRMSLSGIEGEWVFKGYFSPLEQDFSRLRKIILTIAMLPRPVLAEALEKKHFLLISGRVGISEGKIVEEPTIASITEGLREIYVEEFRAFQEDWKAGKGETDMPVVVFQRH